MSRDDFSDVPPGDRVGLSGEERGYLEPPDVRLSPRTSAWVWWALLAGLPLTAGLAWLLSDLADGWVWTIGAAGGGLVLLLLVVAVLRFASSALTKLRPKDWGLFAYAVAIWGVWTGVGYLSLRTPVHIDNFSPRAVRLELDGQPWLDVPSGQMQTARLARWDHQIVTRDAGTGQELDRRTVTVDASKAFIFNVLGAGTYLRGSVTYGMHFFGPDEKEVRDTWIKADVDHLFEHPPQKIQVSEHTFIATRSYLKRKQAGPADGR
jgi:hypothetical protein